MQRIALIDDDEDILTSVSIALELEGYKVVTYRDGRVAGLVGIEGGVVSGVINLESLGVRAPSRRPRHENRYHDA